MSTRILVVDDDPGIRELTAEFLTRHGYRADTAADASGLREKLSAHSYALIVLDVMMPGESGFDYAREVRQTSRVPILMLTAKAMPDDQARCLDAGANDYMAKPIDVDKLLSLVRVWMPR